jgi:UDP-glucose 4-epimerase
VVECEGGSMKVLVTGGAGFIGSHLVDRLVQEGHEVIIVDNLVTGKRRNINRAARFYKQDIQSWRLERVFRNERPNVVMHLAAQMDVRKSVEDPMFDAQVNILGTLNVLQQAVKHGVRKVIFSSSGGAIYGEQEMYPAAESHVTKPLSPYGLSKLCGEQYLSYYQRSSGLQVVSLRYANVYGPRQDPEGEAGVVAIFIQKMLNNEQAVINGNGRQTRDFVFVEDVVEANLAVMGQETQGTYNVGTGVETSINDLFRILVQHTGSTSKEVHGPAKKGEQARSVIDNTRLRHELSWEPKGELSEGLKKTVEYFRERLG